MKYHLHVVTQDDYTDYVCAAFDIGPLTLVLYDDEESEHPAKLVMLHKAVHVDIERVEEEH